MEDNDFELKLENERLKQTIQLAKKQLDGVDKANENNKKEIMLAKKELRENTQHSISNLWSSEGFESLIELSQYATPVSRKIDDYETLEKKKLVLKKLIKSPYFARIDFKFDGEYEFEKIYIGRSSLIKDNPYEMYIYDWRSPIASIFYRFTIGKAFYEAPKGKIIGEVNLKRQYEIKNGLLECFFDTDVQIIDEFLRKMLSQNTSANMKTIVETIQQDQDIVIRDMASDLMMVQGVAGSGKTSIALHRVAYLMYQGLSSKLSANNIIIISPNYLFEQYISSVLPELGEDNVVSLVFDEILAKILKTDFIESKNQFLENLILSNNEDIIRRSMEFKTSKQFMDIINRFISDLPYKWINFKDVIYDGSCMVTKERLKDRILMGRKETCLGLKLSLIEDFVLDLVNESQIKHIKKSEEDEIREQIREFTKLNVQNIYRILFSNKEYFYSLAKGIELPSYIEDIILFTQKNLESNFLYYDDSIAMAFLHLKINEFNEYKDIKQVVIDEAQDYYPIHFEIFKILFPTSKYTVLGDINQTIEKKENLSFYQEISKTLEKKTPSLVSMNKSFRCTNEILNYSSRFIDETIEIKSFNRKGKEPKVYSNYDETSLINIITWEIKNCLDLGYQSIGLICKSEKNAIALFDNLKCKIPVQLIKNESVANLNGIFIIPVYMSKGLEFDAVLILDVNNENYNNENDKKLLYVACTRALHRLNLFCEGEKSSLLGIVE